MVWLVVSLGGTSARAAPPPADMTLRWGVGTVECHPTGDVRSNQDWCFGAENNVTFQIRAVAPTAPGDPRVTVVRRDGTHARAPQRWSRTVDLGTPAGAPVIAVNDEVVVVAAVGGGAVHVATASASDGRVGPPQRVLDRDAAQVQLAILRGGAIRVYVLLRSGQGRVIAVDAAGKPTLVREVPAHAIQYSMDRAARPADGEASVMLGRDKVVARWDDANLVVTHPRWTRDLVTGDRSRQVAVTMHAAGDRVVATLSTSGSSGVSAVALDGRTGAELWRRDVTGIGPVVSTLPYTARVAARVRGDLLVVQGIIAGTAVVCTLAVSDGAELACVDQLLRTAVVDPGPVVHVPKPLPTDPPRPIGPQTTAPTCTPSRSPVAPSLVVKRVALTTIGGTIVVASATCSPKLGGGIVGDRIELDIWDGVARPAPSPCTCTFRFEQEIRAESRLVIGRVRDGATIGLVRVPTL